MYSMRKLCRCLWLKLITTMLKYGKYCGQPFEDVVRLDPGYAAWVLREQRRGQLSRNYSNFAKFIRDRYGGIMPVGRFKGQFYNDVVQDEQYS